MGPKGEAVDRMWLIHYYPWIFYPSLLAEDLTLPPLEREDIGLLYPHQGWSVMCHGFLKGSWKWPVLCLDDKRLLCLKSLLCSHHAYCWEGVEWMNMQFPGLLVHIWVVAYLELLGIMALWIHPFFRMFAPASTWLQDSHGFMHALVQRLPESIALRNEYKVRLWCWL